MNLYLMWKRVAMTDVKFIMKIKKIRSADFWDEASVTS